MARSGTDCSAVASRTRSILAVATPLLDLIAAGLILALDQPNAFLIGWTVQWPLGCAVIRLAWLLVLVPMHIGCREPTACLKDTRTYLELAFPYIMYTGLGTGGIINIVTDSPNTAQVPPKDVVYFWAAGLVGAIATAGEMYFTLPSLPALQVWLTARRGASPAIDALDTELLPTVEPEGPGMNTSSTTSMVSVTSARAVQSAAGSSSSNAEEESPAVGKTCKDLGALVLHEWKLVICAAAMLVLAAISEALIPHFIGEAISSMVAAERAGTLQERPYKGPLLDLVITALCCGFFSACRGANFILIGGRAGARLRRQLFEHLLAQEMGFFDNTKVGELTSRMTADCQKVVDQVTLNINVFLRMIVQVTTTLFFMFTLAPPLMACSFVSVPAVVAISKKYGAEMESLSERIQKHLADANSVADEALSSMRTVRMFAGERHESLRFLEKLKEYLRGTNKRALLYLGYLTTVSALPNLVTALVLAYGGKLAVEGVIETKVLLSFVFYLQILNLDFTSLGDYYTSMMDAFGAFARVQKLLEREPKIPLEPPGGGRSLPSGPDAVEGEVVISKIYFAYPARPDIQILKGLSLTVPANSAVALVGPSGNGKSTVISLLTRLYKVSEGSVTIDGVDIWEYGHQAYHSLVSLVGQEPVLFAKSIKGNIAYGIGNPGETDPVGMEDILEASRTANADVFVKDMTEGYDTEVGERGVQLSGGQKQRIAIARALVRRPRLLMLDEATSALDAESEAQVQQAIDSMLKLGRMTVILVAHRLSTVKNSSKICVVENGEVAEEGTHIDLLAIEGAYYNLVHAQLGQPEKPS